MITTVSAPNAAIVGDAGEFGPLRAVSVNIRPLLESVGGLLSGAEIDAWFVGFDRANEGRGFYLELTGEGELVVNPMVNSNSAMAELEFGADLMIWAREYGGEAYGASVIVRLPDGSRVRPDASWLSPEQVAQLPPVGIRGAITVCPAFVAEIRSDTDNLAPLQRKMERYIANGALLGWLIDPYLRQVHVYRPSAEPELLEDPETVSGGEALPGFALQVRRRIFRLHQPTQE